MCNKMANSQVYSKHGEVQPYMSEPQSNSNAEESVVPKKSVTSRHSRIVIAACIFNVFMLFGSL